MRLVDNHGKALTGQLTHTIHDHSELLHRCDDDALPVLQSAPQVAGRHAIIRGNVDQHASGFDHLIERALELAVNHPTIGNNDDRAEDRLAIGSM